MMENMNSDMRLGSFEFLAMNNHLRQWWQRHVELPIFLAMLRRQQIDLRGKAIMDVGCGSGYSTKLILQKLKPSRLIAFDLMPEQIRLAEKRGLNVTFHVGDATMMEADDACCDGVFIFGVLHHIPTWRRALAETARVLKPGGVLLLEEPHYRFDWPELEDGLQAVGLHILEHKKWLMGYFRSYLCKHV